MSSNDNLPAVPALPASGHDPVAAEIAAIRAEVRNNPDRAVALEARQLALIEAQRSGEGERDLSLSSDAPPAAYDIFKALSQPERVAIASGFKGLPVPTQQAIIQELRRAPIGGDANLNDRLVRLEDTLSRDAAAEISTWIARRWTGRMFNVVAQALGGI